jgi:hypothetical protein
MVIFKPKIPIWVNEGLAMMLVFLGHLVNFPATWYILWSFCIFSPVLVYFVVIWYIFLRFAMLYITIKSGIPNVKKEISKSIFKKFCQHVCTYTMASDSGCQQVI